LLLAAADVVIVGGLEDVKILHHKHHQTENDLASITARLLLRDDVKALSTQHENEFQQKNNLIKLPHLLMPRRH